jgi:hypothetical protein
MHNETLNIYTHLIPCLAFIGSEWYLISHLYEKYDKLSFTDVFIFTFFLITAAGCLGLSATYHTLINHSYQVETLWLRLDFAGIVLLTLGDFVSGIYMVFWCEPTLRKVYWTMVCATCFSPERMQSFLTSHPYYNPRCRCHIRPRQPQVSRQEVEILPSPCIGDNWSIRLCSSHPRQHSLWLFADDEAIWNAILPYRRSLSNFRSAYICG